MKLNNFFYTLLVGLLLVNCTSKPKGYTINGTFDKSIEGEKVVLFDYKFDTIAVADVVDGKFTITGSVTEPELAQLTYGRAFGKMILENQDYDVAMTKMGVGISGAGVHNTVFGYRTSEKFFQLAEQENKTREKAMQGVDQKDGAAIEAALKPYRKELRVVRDFILEQERAVLNGDYPALTKLFVLNQHYDWDKYGHEQKLALLDEYKKELGEDHGYLKQSIEMYTRGLEQQKLTESVGAGKPFKEVVATSIDGETIKLSDVVAKNKYTLVEFWASWCGPCRGSFPHLKKVYAAYKEKGFEIYGLSLDTDKEKYLKASKEEQIPWINTVDYAAFKSEAAVTYGVSGIPYTLLIGNDGIIVGAGNDIRGAGLDDLLEELLGKVEVKH